MWRRPLALWRYPRGATQSRMPLLFFAGTALLLGGGLLVAFVVWQLRTDALDEARRDNANLALVLAEQTARSVQTIDMVLRDLQDGLEKYDLESLADFWRTLGSETIHQLLKDRSARLTHVDSIALIGAAGTLVNSSRQWPVPKLSLADRDFYRHFNETKDSQTFISQPSQNRTTGIWTLYVARRLTSVRGEFLGVIIGGVQLRYFEDIYRSINLSRQESFLLARRDGTILVRHPDLTARAGQKIPADSPWHQQVANGGGGFVSPGIFDNLSRMVRVQVVRDYPLVLNVGVTEAAALATWRRQAAIILGGSLMVFLYTIFLMRLVHTQFFTLKQSEASLTHQNDELVHLSQQLKSSEAHLEEKTSELETTLETMDQGLLMVDATGKVVVCNKQAMELLQLPQAFMASHPLFVDVLDYQWRINRSREGIGTFEDFVRARTIVDRQHTTELRRPDGRVLEMRSVPLADGGVVRTYTDITQRKTMEERTHYLAHHDDLTRLDNRIAFREHLDEAIVAANTSRRGLAVLYVDLDHFKQVNDRCGHAGGDRFLAEAAQRMKSVVRSIDTVARIGGDEFAIIVPFLDDPSIVLALGERLVRVLGMPFEIDSEAVPMGASIGIAFRSEDGSTAEELVSHADEALYVAKSAGRNTFRVYQPRHAGHLPQQTAS
ncbi:MAG: hypothetical protein JWN71_3528 [Xanthobacteraceae bacterium]|jgi:diguanylate cyclase (GGDEF)-like protein|nr:hypothetical protein [Xanthobacteraceae bacterium]